jgi:hypothetical protein
MRHLGTLGVAPPADPRDRVQSGRFLRTLLLRWLVVSIAAWAFVLMLADLPTWCLILGAASLAALAADVLWLTYRVRKDERRVAAR